MKTSVSQPGRPSGPTLFTLIQPYKGWIVLLIFVTMVGDALNLVIPKLISHSIDSYTAGTLIVSRVVIEFGLISIGIFLFAYLANMTQTYASEKIARDLRVQLADKISRQDYPSIQQATSAKLLTNLTSDIDAVKSFISQAIASMISSLFLIVVASVLLLLINWKLALIVLLVVPISGLTFFFIFRRIRHLFKRGQEAVDWLNKVINESILGAALIRLVHSRETEHEKFLAANRESQQIGMETLKMFASMIPIITFATNLATLAILLLGGRLVMTGGMSLGDFAAFNSYLVILVFPIFILGFVSNLIAQASASYARVSEMLSKPDPKPTGTLEAVPGGSIRLEDVSMVYGEKRALQDISFVVQAGTKTAIIGPTAAGKSQLLYLLTGLIEPTHGTVRYAEQELKAYDPASLHQQIAFVFQDSILFNLTLRENIAFHTSINEVDLKKAIETAELSEFIETLPEQLDTLVSERGTSLSGGQKQRVMLARALAMNPSVLLLDDFTARVDVRTEQRILENIQKNYPGITLISVTQKLASVEHYDQILLLMEGELLAKGTHTELMESSPEYVQIFTSQRSTSMYELPTE